MIAMKYTALVTLLACVFTFVLSGRAGAMRGKHGVNAPATAGNEEFEKAFRIHANTVEQLVLFVPVLWMATMVIGDLYAAAIGAVWLVGRFMYSGAYMKNPPSRTPGMVTTVLATGVLALVSAWGIIAAFLA